MKPWSFKPLEIDRTPKWTRRSHGVTYESCPEWHIAGVPSYSLCPCKLPHVKCGGAFLGQVAATWLASSIQDLATCRCSWITIGSFRLISTHNRVVGAVIRVTVMSCRKCLSTKSHFTLVTYAFPRIGSLDDPIMTRLACRSCFDRLDARRELHLRPASSSLV